MAEPQRLPEEDRAMSLTRAEVESVAQQAARKAMRDLLLTLGIDVSNPLEAQRDFAILREIADLVRDPEFRKDLEHTRKWRKALEALETKSALAVVTAVLGGVAAMLWIGFKVMVTGKP